MVVLLYVWGHDDTDVRAWGLTLIVCSSSSSVTPDPTIGATGPLHIYVMENRDPRSRPLVLFLLGSVSNHGATKSPRLCCLLRLRPREPNTRWTRKAAAALPREPANVSRLARIWPQQAKIWPRWRGEKARVMIVSKWKARVAVAVGDWPASCAQGKGMEAHFFSYAGFGVGRSRRTMSGRRF